MIWLVIGIHASLVAAVFWIALKAPLIGVDDDPEDW